MFRWIELNTILHCFYSIMYSHDKFMQCLHKTGIVLLKKNCSNILNVKRKTNKVNRVTI
jgi:hypothetical protein